MDCAYNLFGGAPVLKKYQTNATISRVGQPFMIPAANGAGVPLCTVSSATDFMGVNLDTATYATAQGSTDPAALLTLNIRPDSVYKARLSGSATEGTALTLYDVTVASTSGLVVQTGDDWSTVTQDEGTIWGYDGANAGIMRKITSVSTSDATVTVAFPYDTVVGDNFLRAPFTPGQSTLVLLSTNVTEIDCSSAVGSGGTWRVIELQAADASANGRYNSFAFIQASDSVFAGQLT